MSEQSNDASDAASARARLGSEAVLSVHLYTLTAAVRALLSTHPNPVQARNSFSQLIGQMQAHPAFLASPDHALVMRDFVGTLFQHPVDLDRSPTDDPS